MTRTQSTPFFDHIIAWSISHSLPPFARYATATALIVLVAILRVMFIPAILPWLMFVPAIMFIALMLGDGAGLYASVLATIAAAITIASPAEPWWLTGPQWIASALFIVVAAGLARLGGEVRAAFRRTKLLNVELAEREAFLSSVLASSTDCIKVIDLDGRLTFMSEGGMKVMELPDFNTVAGCQWADLWEGSGKADVQSAVERARMGEATHFVGRADTYAGTPKSWDVSVSPILGPDGKPDRILAVSRDSTELLASQEELKLLNGELSHRLKNVLALIQSIANQTFRQAESVETASAAFADRLAALGKATDTLTAAAWQSATLHDVVDAGLTAVDGMADRIRIDGPPVDVTPQVALAMTLALHELATNACKYGALSNENGMIALTWRYDPGDNGQDGRFHLEWKEAGGPMVQPPTRQGFGSKMIERSLRAYFRGDTTLAYKPDGLIFTIDAPLSPASPVIGA